MNTGKLSTLLNDLRAKVTVYEEKIEEYKEEHKALHNELSSVLKELTRLRIDNKQLMDHYIEVMCERNRYKAMCNSYSLTIDL